MNKWIKFALLTLSHIFVATLAVTVLLLTRQPEDSKLERLQDLLESRYVGETDSVALQDAAADAMVQAIGDRWSYYISAEEYASHMEQKKNAYVGIGVTISMREDNTGFDVLLVEPGGPAQEAGIRPGDIMTHVEGQPVWELGLESATAIVKGKEGTTVHLTFLRDGQTMELEVERRTIQVAVTTYEMLPGNIGYIKINNFNTKCADETIAAVDALRAQGATALIFDVRNNPGGYVDELVEVLDYLLPEGVLFRSETYDGIVSEDKSDKKCVEMPMAVLYNGNSYSAAEFFAAALEEYDWAITVGDPTSGKSRYQYTYDLGDGSAVNLSVGKYFTPKGVELAAVGGLTPQVLVEVDEETASLIYSGLLEKENDPQLQAAVEALKESAD